MSLIQHGFFPRSMFDTDFMFNPKDLGLGLPPTTLDIFDPFDELDRIMSRNLFWLERPEFMRDIPIAPKVPKKFRVTADIKGFDPKSIKTQISDDKSKLVITGKEGEGKKSEEEDYNLREFRRTYKLPENAELDKLVSFATSNEKLVVEIPIKEEEEQKEEHFPKIVEEEGGKKHLELNVRFPETIDPSKIKVTCKDRDVIIQAEDKQEKEDTFSRISYYRRTTLPENTDFKSLKCQCDKNQISIKASINPELSSQRSIPIEITCGTEKRLESTPSKSEAEASEETKSKEQAQQSSEQGKQQYQEYQQPSEQAQQPSGEVQKTQEKIETASEKMEKQEQQTSQKEQAQPSEQQQQTQQSDVETQKSVQEQGKEKGRGDIPIENIPVERER